MYTQPHRGSGRAVAGLATMSTLERYPESMAQFTFPQALFGSRP